MPLLVSQPASTEEAPPPKIALLDIKLPVPYNEYVLNDLSEKGMRNYIIFLLLLIFSLVPASTAVAAENFVSVITINDEVINPVIAQYISQAIDRAEQDGAEALIIKLDTPGGLLASTRTIVKEELNASVPIIVYVSPSGARAGSAGVFITLAANIAAMAPSTNIGAAHPVDIGGGGGDSSWRESFNELQRKLKEMEDRHQNKEKPGGQTQPAGKEEPAQTTGSTMGDKILHDTVAWMRAIAHERGRNEEWAVKSVTESVSIPETEALEKNVINFISKDIKELLAQVDGVEVKTAAGAVTLHTKDAAIKYSDMNTRERILNAISNPNVAYILMMLGFFGLLFEVTHTGAWFPGIAGAICLILAFYSFQALPINYAGALLIILALIMFIAEAKVASYGLLTIGGIICMTLGSLMLINTPYSFLKISTTVIFPTVFATAAIVVFLVTLIIRAHSRRSIVGQEGLIGMIGIAETDIAPDGKIFVHGEIWNARSADSIKKGDRVKIKRVEGMMLTVESVRS
jgi:membrane-bound serine protease (ClpP class)